MNQPSSTLLQVEGLSVVFDAGKPTEHRALDCVNLDISCGESLAVVGESGSGKTVLARSIIGLLPDSATASSRAMTWEDEEMTAFSSDRWRKWRRDSVAVVWQNPQGSLVPVYPVGRQMHWLLRLHGVDSRKNREQKMLELFNRVGLQNPERVARRYPEQLSGGECQRVMVAMALSRRPKLLIADEPTSNLDVKLQSEIIGLIKELAGELQLAILFITHDLALASRITKRTVVLYRGQVVEEGPTAEVLTEPKHHYTKELVVGASLAAGKESI